MKKIMDVIKILIVDDHALVREALRNTLEKQQDFKVIAEASDGELAVKLASELAPNVVIMDITMPKLDGLEATRRIKSENSSIGVLALTMHDDEEFMLKMIQAGADGYLTKSILGRDVVSAVRALTAGEMVLSPSILRKVVTYSNQRIQNKSTISHSTADKLTARELEILRLVAKGAANKDIAFKLGLSVRTVKGHLLILFAKVGAKSRTEAIVIGLRMGVLTIDDLIK